MKIIHIKFVVLHAHKYCIKKVVKGKTTFEAIEPQPLSENIIELCRYYCTLKRCETYKRRISRIKNSSSNVALIEYIGSYPENIAPHENAIYQDTAYTRTDPNVLQTIEQLSRYNPPRDV